MMHSPIGIRKNYRISSVRVRNGVSITHNKKDATNSVYGFFFPHSTTFISIIYRVGMTLVSMGRIRFRRQISTPWLTMASSSTTTTRYLFALRPELRYSLGSTPYTTVKTSLCFLPHVTLRKFVLCVQGIIFFFTEDEAL